MADSGELQSTFQTRSDRILMALLQGAIILFIFCGIVALWMVGDYSRRVKKDPFEDTHFLELKNELKKDPSNDVLKKRIQTLDRQLRQEYFGKKQLAALGGLLLLVGGIVSLLAAREITTIRRRLPNPSPKSPGEESELLSKRFARLATVGLATALAVSVLFLVIALHTPLTAERTVVNRSSEGNNAPVAQNAQPTAGKPDTPAKADQAPTAEEFAANWPRFRGHDGSGIVKDMPIPTTWDSESGKSIVWKTEVPMIGNNSPIVWNDRIFLSGATDKQRKVFCFNAADGKLAWTTEIAPTPQTPAQPPKVSPDTGFAAPTMATDGRRAFAMFANGDIAGLDFAGKILWSRSLGRPESEYGHAASLAVYQNTVLVQLDQGGAKEGKSKMVALDVLSGKTVWETPRQSPNSWSSPIVVRHADHDLLITTADPFAIAYNPADGKEIWRMKCLRQDVGPSPVYAAGRVFAVSEFPCLTAFKADGTGDITASAKLWIGEDGLPDTCSPLATDEMVLLLSTPGTLTAYDAANGKKLWEQDFESQFKASPSLVGKRLYLIGDEGKSWIVEPGKKECKEIGTGSLGEEKCTASPAFRNGRMFLRTEKFLYCIGAK